MRITSIGVLFTLLAASAAHAQLAQAFDYNDRGNRALESGKAEEAAGLYREALVIWRASGPEYDAHRAGTLFNLGIAVSSSGNRVEAVKIFEQALEIHRRTLGLQQIRTLSNMNLLAANYVMLGRDSEAEQLFLESLPLVRQHFPGNVQEARALEGLSAVYLRQDKVEEARVLGEEALKVAIAAQGDESLDAALAYANMGEVHRAAGHNERALPIIRRSRSIYSSHLGPSHPRVAALLSEEGMILMEDGKLAMADQVMSDALNALEERCPNCTFEIAMAENNLATLRIKQKRYGEADKLLTRVIARRERFTTAPGRELAETLRLLAAVRKLEKRNEDVEALTRRADTIMGLR